MKTAWAKNLQQNIPILKNKITLISGVGIAIRVAIVAIVNLVTIVKM